MAGEDDAELKARLAALSRKLAETGQAPEKSADETPLDGATGRAMSQGMKAMGEFVGAIGVSAVIGWKLDDWLGTAPALLLVFLALGTVAGFWNIYRMSAGPSARGGFGRNGKK
ncbi:MAG TPA: AtpZ/AtpI family protein [Beijerinckiaceae bacterium]|nr:AtpZ/AtpI family protein [Beijerinckiaceae bacterium]